MEKLNIVPLSPCQPLTFWLVVRPVLDFSMAHIIGTSLLHSKLDYCNSLYYGLPKTQLTRLQHIQNSLARAVAAPRSSDPDQILKSLHWIKVQERIEYNIISTSYKVLQSSSPHYLRDIIAIQPSRSTQLSSLVTLLHPQAQSSLKITNRSFWYAAPHLWNKLPPSLRVPCQLATSEYSPLPGSDSAPKSVVGVSHRVFHSRLKTHLFSRSFPP